MYKMNKILEYNIYLSIYLFIYLSYNLYNTFTV